MGKAFLLVTNYVFTKIKIVDVCSAANIAYRKSAFERSMDTKESWNQPSGDDEFLLRKLRKKYPKGSCVYVIQAGALVYTVSKKLASLDPAAGIAGPSNGAHINLSPFLSAISHFWFNLYG